MINILNVYNIQIILPLWPLCKIYNIYYIIILLLYYYILYYIPIISLSIINPRPQKRGDALLPQEKGWSSQRNHACGEFFSMSTVGRTDNGTCKNSTADQRKYEKVRNRVLTSKMLGGRIGVRILAPLWQRCYFLCVDEDALGIFDLRWIVYRSDFWLELNNMQRWYLLWVEE